MRRGDRNSENVTEKSTLPIVSGLETIRGGFEERFFTFLYVGRGNCFFLLPGGSHNCCNELSGLCGICNDYFGLISLEATWCVLYLLISVSNLTCPL